MRLSRSEQLTMEMALRQYTDRVRIMAERDVRRVPALADSWTRRLAELDGLCRRIRGGQKNRLTSLLARVF